MVTPNQREPAEPDALLSDIPCCDNVCIPRSRYKQLIRAEVEREILFNAYQCVEMYNIEFILDARFNPKCKYRGKEAPGGEAGGSDAK